MRAVSSRCLQDQGHSHWGAGENPTRDAGTSEVAKSANVFSQPTAKMGASPGDPPLLLLKASPSPSARLGIPSGREEFSTANFLKVNKAPEKRRGKPQTVFPDCRPRGSAGGLRAAQMGFGLDPALQHSLPSTFLPQHCRASSRG